MNEFRIFAGDWKWQLKSIFSATTNSKTTVQMIQISMQSKCLEAVFLSSSPSAHESLIGTSSACTRMYQTNVGLHKRTSVPLIRTQFQQSSQQSLVFVTVTHPREELRTVLLAATEAALNMVQNLHRWGRCFFSWRSSRGCCTRPWKWNYFSESGNRKK